MKKAVSFLVAGVALVCALLSSACTSTPPAPITLSDAELESAADALYSKLCQSGVLDKIAAENEDAEEDELPVVEYDRMVTNKWRNRGKTDPYVLVKRFIEKLQAGGHMIVMDDTRTGVEAGEGKAVDNLIGQNEDDSTAMSLDELTAGPAESDYHVKGEIYDDVKRLQSWQTVQYTIAISLTKPTKKGTRTLWSGKVRIEKSREF